MLFSSLVFLFIFLPVTCFFYFLSPKKFRNTILIISSLIFYAWGEPKYIILMLFSILINYILTILIDKQSSVKKAKLILILTIVINLLLIGIFKYLDFGILTFNQIFNLKIPFANIALPIGISFYTFKILSYVIDVYKKKIKAQKNIIHLATYIAFFPQLMAGPIVRYGAIEDELKNRTITAESFIAGIRRFIFGFAKKVIIANNMALLADTVYNSSNLGSINSLILWIAGIAYTFQIYFDFSGYSDMAIGLSKMFGFTSLENFNYPYIAKSITDFWRRWHISLSSWFKDYLYIPLGGNRCSVLKWIRNVLIVWSLTGLWHGASWNFVMWGLYFSIFLILEKTLFKNIIEKTPKFITWMITMLIVIISWVIFRITDIDNLLMVLKNMFAFKFGSLDLLLNNYDVFIALMLMPIAALASLPIFKNIALKLFNKNKCLMILSYIIILGLYILCICLLLSNSYNPFIYFKF